MEVNKEELRRLANINISDMHAWPSDPSERHDNLEAFRLHANPTAVLSLLDELERKERVIHQCSKDFDDLQESIDSGYRARMKYKRERDQLRAEVEGLRKDARVGSDAYRSLLNALHRDVGLDRFGPSRLQRMFLINTSRACRLIDEMTARSDIECDGEGYGRRFPRTEESAND